MCAIGDLLLETIEALAIEADGTAWLGTDNDGTDDSSGQTLLWSIGPVE